MYAQSIVFDLDKRLNLTDLVKKVKNLNFVEGSNVLYSDIGELKIIVFPNGRIRLTKPDGTYGDLSALLGRYGFQLGKLLDQIREVSGSDMDVGAILNSQAQERPTYESLSSNPYREMRPNFSEKLSVGVLNGIILGSAEVLSEFQQERFQTQAGELLGRQSVKSIDPKNEEECLEVVKRTIKENYLGIADIKKGGKEAGADFLVKISECFCIGSPAYGKPICHIIRGIIRGSLCAFLRQENVSVREVKCWAKGTPPASSRSGYSRFDLVRSGSILI